MTKLSMLTRPGMTAIAAFAALSSAPSLAQAADPLAPSSDPAPSVTTTPPVEATTPTADVSPVADPLAAAPTATATTKPAVKSARTTAARATTRTVARTTAKPLTARVAPVAAAAPIASVAPPAPAEIAPPVAVPAPLPPEAPIATAPVAAPISNPSLPADALPIAGGLGALALAAAALAMRRRRRLAVETEESRYEEPAFAAEAPADYEPMIQPEPIRNETPAMAWGSAAAAPIAASAEPHPLVEGEVPEGLDPTSHAAAAYRGPSADNPSLSLKKRLKRAAFFDQRDKLAADGLAAPIAPDAGLPEAMDAPETPRSDPVPVKPAIRPLTSGGGFTYKPAFQPA